MGFFAYINNIFSRRMGCVNSRREINDCHPRIFHVMNVDQGGNLISPGKLEVTESDIILHQKRRPPIKWPLRCVRRYGLGTELISFEAGRRCSTGPGIYAFACRRAVQLFNLIQANIRQVYISRNDITIREIENNLQFRPIPRMTIPSESNYLDPTPVRSNETGVSSFFHNQQNGTGRICSIESSNGPISPQTTMGSPSPPPGLPSSLPPPPPVPQIYPSLLYINEEIVQSTLSSDLEQNNNKSLARRCMQRSHTVSSSTSSSGISSSELATQVTVTERCPVNKSRVTAAAQPPFPSYMNVDLSTKASLLSSSQNALESSTPVKEVKNDTIDCNKRTYMNISPDKDRMELVLPVSKARPTGLSITPHHSELEEIKHCYANLEASEIEGLKKRFSSTSISEKLSTRPQTPIPINNSTGVIKKLSYVVLDLDKKDVPSSTNFIPSTSTTMTTATATTSANFTSTATLTAADSSLVSQLPTPSRPDSPLKIQPLSYATIDFNKTTALSYSVNSSLVNEIDEGSRKTRHNSTISELISSPSTRHNSSISE